MVEKLTQRGWPKLAHSSSPDGAKTMGGSTVGILPKSLSDSGITTANEPKIFLVDWDIQVMCVRYHARCKWKLKST